MRFVFSSRFRKAVRKRPERIQELVLERLGLFRNDRNHPLLNDHPLGGKLAGSRSISVSGDLRIKYEPPSTGPIYFFDFRTHNYLYGTKNTNPRGGWSPGGFVLESPY